MKKTLILLCVLAMLVVACGGTGDTPVPSPAGEDTVVVQEATQEPEPKPEGQDPPEPQDQEVDEQERTTVRLALADWDLPAYQGLIESFEEDNPDLQVQVVSVNEVLDLGPIGQLDIPDDADQRLVAAADVVEIGISRQTVNDGLVLDLTPLIESERNLSVDDFVLDALDNYQWDGGTWALPATVNVRLIYFNKDLFDEAGVPYPEEGWTWDDLLAKAQAVTQRDGDQVSMWGFVADPGLAYRLIESRTGPLKDDTTDPPAPVFDEPDVLDSVGWYTDLYLAEQVMPYSASQDDEEQLALSDAATLIEKGQAAMWPDFDALYWYRNQQSNVGVAPFPDGGSNSLGTPAWMEHWVISAGTTQPEAAWRLVEFLSRQVQEGLGEGMKTLPARRSATEVAGFWDDMDEELAAALRYALENGYVAGEPVGYNAFDEAIQAIMNGEKTPEQAMADAQAQAEMAIEDQLAEQSGATPVPTFVVSEEEDDPVEEGVVTITFIPGLGSLNLEPYRDLTEQFHETNPDVVVEVKMADIMGGTAPDLAAMSQDADCFEWFASLQDAKAREAILALEPFIDADPLITTDDYAAPVLEQFTWQGQLWGLPADITPYTFEYNKDLFDAAGLEYPTQDWTWDDFLETTAALTQGEEETKQYGFVSEVYELNDLLVILDRLGAKLIDESADPPAFTFTDPSTVEAMRWYVSLSNEHQVKPVFLTDITKLLGASAAVLEREALINDGRAGLWTGAGTAASVFGGREDLSVGVAPLPIRADGSSGASYTAVSGYFISSETENRQACWQWIAFLSEQPGAAQGLPARLSTAESNEYRESVGADKADAYLASVGDASRSSTFQTFADEDWLGIGIVWLGQAYGQIVEGEASVEDALAAAQQLSDDYRACVVAAGSFDTETSEACAKEVDPTLPAFMFSSGG